MLNKKPNNNYMKKIDFKSKRFKLVFGIVIFMMLTTLLAIFKDMEGLASACIGNIMIVGGIYLWGETKRPSENIVK